MSNLVTRAEQLATVAHAGQFRKYSGDPFISHPKYVVDILAGEHKTVRAAAWLHDVVEDTDYTIEDIYTVFGERVAELVDEVTNEPKSSFGDIPRSERTAINRDRLSNISIDGKKIKLADTLHNISDLPEADPEFAKVYLPEKLLLVEALRGHQVLESLCNMVEETIVEGLNELEMSTDIKDYR